MIKENIFKNNNIMIKESKKSKNKKHVLKNNNKMMKENSVQENYEYNYNNTIKILNNCQSAELDIEFQFFDELFISYILKRSIILLLSHYSM